MAWEILYLAQLKRARQHNLVPSLGLGERIYTLRPLWIHLVISANDVPLWQLQSVPIFPTLTSLNYMQPPKQHRLMEDPDLLHFILPNSTSSSSSAFASHFRWNEMSQIMSHLWEAICLDRLCKVRDLFTLNDMSFSRCCLFCRCL